MPMNCLFLLVFVTVSTIIIFMVSCFSVSLSLGRNSSKYDKYCKKQTTFLKDMFRHAYAIISLMSS